MSDTVYRILPRQDWLTAQALDVMRPSDLDRRDGFIHLSPMSQVEETASRYFKVHQEPVAIALDVERLGANLRWERVPGRDNLPFPHYYAPNIPVALVDEVRLLLPHEGRFVWGPRISL